MAAPFPYEATPGSLVDPAETEALNLYRNYVWVARLIDEMNIEVDLDLKRTMQLVFHLRQFRRWYDELQNKIAKGTHTQAQIADILQGIFAMKKCSWTTRASMNTDLAAIYNSAVVADWIEANVGEYKQGYSVNKEVAPGVMTDEPIKIAKPASVATRLSDFRALFAAKG